MDDAQALLTQVFDAYNRGDWRAFAALVTPDIDWPNQTEGGRVVGLEALEVYCRRNSQLIRVELAVRAFDVQPDGRIAVDLDQTVHNASTGRLWSDSRVRHHYIVRDGRVARMDVEPLASRT
jgi:ketosteroid isomerase-like protein